MSYRTHCDWCGEHLAFEDDQAVMPVTLYHRRGKGSLDSKWAEETGVTRHFCAPPKKDASDTTPRSATCYERAVEAIKGTPVADPGMGMEWRIVPVAGEDSPPAADRAAPDRQETVPFADTLVTRELLGVIVAKLPAGKQAILPHHGVVSLDQVDAMTDEQLLAIDGIGKRSVRHLRDALAERDRYDGRTLARKVYDLLQAGLPRIGEEDPMQPVLAGALPAFAAALGQAQEA
jgi:hypothetical protein